MAGRGETIKFRYILVFPFMAAALVLLLQAPRLWVMTDYRPGTFQWDRAQTFLLQVSEPFRSDIEAAMRWRLLPPLVGHYLQLPGYWPFVIPWIGLFCLLAYVGRLLWERHASAAYVFGGVLLVATTSAAIVPLHWYGINDAWVWLALLVVAFDRSRAAVLAAVLLAPWVDERFIIGLPLAWLVRGSRTENRLLGRDLWLLAPLLVYAAIRGGLTFFGAGTTVERAFMADSLRMAAGWVGLTPLGWWFGLRAAWFPLGAAVADQRPTSRVLFVCVMLATYGLTTITAADISRSSAIVLPVVVLGMLGFPARFGPKAGRVLLWTGIAGILLPMAHIVGRKIDPVENIAIEIMRLFTP
ncbi:hypothetical protein [Prosthecomicrobium pneumaticum]|uniref:Glycosyltransferase RgtA/B/C/D-like domain-containing protein n=1 Tax=Prosthecomicrobium pneumaticum TaxID=81895 RepID=A0A7W9CTA4_9HYPH|nr:hypothetical protein [Prosthecomicrobium pneumaticum]MBB5751523.1 hypothetical protein [Prosthecomicrobium pneumaticum]